MAKEQERILIVESDPAAADLLARQALSGMGLQIKVVNEAASALKQAAQFNPDVVIANLNLPGLSGKDLMAALSSRGSSIPVIMVAEKGQEKDVIQAFRLGASDYISAPLREAEVVSAVERALKAVRARKERQELSLQLQRSNQELHKRVAELTTLFAVGKAVTSITDQQTLFQEIILGTIKITHADYGWLLVQDEGSKKFLLRAHRKLPKPFSALMGQVWDDGMSSLVAVSGETLMMHGKPFRRIQISALGKAAMVTPVKVQNQVVALLSVLRKEDAEFSLSDKAMLEAVSDYAAISLANARLFRALDQRAASKK